VRAKGEPKKALWEAEYLDPVQFQCYEHVSGYKSAIKKRYSKELIPITREMDTMLTEFFGGYGEGALTEKQNGNISLTEGRAPLTFKAFKSLLMARKIRH
jgi:hypothetical protein